MKWLLIAICLMWTAIIGILIYTEELSSVITMLGITMATLIISALILKSNEYDY